MKLTKKEIQAIENLGWSVKKTDNGYCLENYSPAGEDMVIEVENKEEIISCCENYDVDEHFDLWYGAHRGEPERPSELQKDCEVQAVMYEELLKVLKGDN